MSSTVAPSIYAESRARFADSDRRFGITRQALRELPLIDISPFATGSGAECLQVARQVRKACIDIGFFYLRGHGLSSTECDEVIAWGHRFFALPDYEKKKVHTDNIRDHPGYAPPGGSNAATDIKERLSFDRETLPEEPAADRLGSGRSQWPDETLLFGFSRCIKSHISKRVAQAQLLAKILALSLEVPETEFSDVFRFLGGTLIFNFYPSLPPMGARSDAEGQRWSFSPHTDYGAFTMMLTESVPGLQVENISGEWIDVPPVPDTLIVNVGDLLSIWTNDLYVSSRHRVSNITGAQRVSIPLFVYPQRETLIRCLKSCSDALNLPRYEEFTVLDYNRGLVEHSKASRLPNMVQHQSHLFRVR